MKPYLRLPKNNWNALIEGVLTIRLDTSASLDQELVQDLTQLNLYGKAGLTETGLHLAELSYVRLNESGVDEVMRSALMVLPVTQALLQSLWGLTNISVNQVKMALLFAGADSTEVDKRLTVFLQLLNRFSVVTYSKKLSTVKLLVSPFDAEDIPSHVFIDPKRPYANHYWIRKIISECRGTIYWVDKYFNKDAFIWLWREALAENITSIKIISVLPGDKPDDALKSDYIDFKKELSNRGIIVEWRVISKAKSHRIHDRWILDDGEVCYNIPSTGTIRSGQASELLRSGNHAEILTMFNRYFEDDAKAV